MDEETIQQLRDDAEHGDTNAQYRLACCLAGGTGVLKDEAEAKRWMQLAAEQGHVDARRVLGWEGGIPSPRMNWAGPFEWVLRLILSKTRWQIAWFFCKIGLVVGIINGSISWVFPPQKSFELEIVAMFGPLIIFLYGLLSAASGVVAGLVLYEIARSCGNDNDMSPKSSKASARD